MSQVIKILVVDDEELAREEIKELLSEYKNIEIIGEADNVNSAIELYKKLKPDVVFLDIQMPIKSGFEFVEYIHPDVDIVFVTAYDEFAIRAFEVNALDYLMKPIYPVRLKQTIDKIVRKNSTKKLSNEKLTVEDFIFLRLRTKSQFVKVGNIICITSNREYTEIITVDGMKGLIHKPMAEWEERLPSQKFIRVHRQSIINLNYVVQLKSFPNKTHKVYLKGINYPINISRRYAAKLKTIII